MAATLEPELAPTAPRRARDTRARRDSRAGLALVSPTVIVVLVMVVLPVLWALILSFQRIRLLQIRRLDLLGGEYTLRNYDLLLNSSEFLTAARTTLLYSVFGTLGAIVLGLKIADPALLLLACLTWAATILCMGAAIAMTVKSLAQFSAVVDIGSTIVAGLSGALVPLSAMPDWARTIAPLWPGYWAMEGLRSAVEGNRHATLVAIAVLLAFATVGAVIAATRLRHGWGRNTLL